MNLCAPIPWRWLQWSLQMFGCARQKLDDCLPAGTSLALTLEPDAALEPARDRGIGSFSRGAGWWPGRGHAGQRLRSDLRCHPLTHVRLVQRGPGTSQRVAWGRKEAREVLSNRTTRFSVPADRGVAGTSRFLGSVSLKGRVSHVQAQLAPRCVNASATSSLSLSPHIA